MKNRGEKKENKRKQADQQGVFLGRIISECKSDDKSTAFYKDCGPADIECVCEGRFGELPALAPAGGTAGLRGQGHAPARRRSQGQRWTAPRAPQTCCAPTLSPCVWASCPRGHLIYGCGYRVAQQTPPSARQPAYVSASRDGQPVTAASAQGGTNPRSSRAVPNWCESKVKFFLACIFGIRFQKQIELLVHG